MMAEKMPGASRFKRVRYLIRTPPADARELLARILADFYFRDLPTPRFNGKFSKSKY
jgi:hypothetical protein